MILSFMRKGLHRQPERKGQLYRPVINALCAYERKVPKGWLCHPTRAKACVMDKGNAQILKNRLTVDQKLK